MPSYSTPSTNLSTGLSTKPTRLIPDYLAKNQNFVPLSVFFAGTKEPEADPDSLFGLRMPSREKKAPPKEKKARSGDSSGDKSAKDKKDDDDEKKGKESEKGKEAPPRPQTAQPRAQQAPQSQAPEKAPQAAQGAKQESEKRGLAMLLDMAIRGQSMEGMTTTANVPTLPVPIGAGDGRKFLDRPGDEKKKKKKKKGSLSRSLHLLLRQ